MADKPENKVRVSDVTATVWKNTGKTKDGKDYEFHSVTLQRSYKDGEDWKNTGNLKVTDLPKAILALQKVYEMLALKEGDNKEE